MQQQSTPKQQKKQTAAANEHLNMMNTSTSHHQHDELQEQAILQSGALQKTGPSLPCSIAAAVKRWISSDVHQSTAHVAKK